MKVKMKNNLILRYQMCSEFKYKNQPINELIAVKEMFGMEEYFKIKQFLKNIEGKVIDVVFTGNDAFEKHNNNFWLPNSLWDAV